MTRKKVDRSDDTKAYSSTAYSMLEVGQKGLFDTYTYNSQISAQSVINITTQNDDAKEEIVSACNNGASQFSYFEAPAGTHWESVTYNYTEKSDENTYVDIRLIGLDGESLKY